MTMPKPSVLCAGMVYAALGLFCVGVWVLGGFIVWTLFRLLVRFLWPAH